MKCCKCKREAKAQQAGYEWMCTRHYRALIKFLRIKRGLEKAQQRNTSNVQIEGQATAEPSNGEQHNG